MTKRIATPALFLAFASVLTAQTGSGSPPATFDYDPATIGVQGPTSLLLAGADYRSLRSYQMTIPVIVPINELRAILPSGIEPVPTPAGSSTATMNLQFFMDQRFTLTKSGQTYGPVSALLAATTVMNNNVTPARQELALPVFEASGEVDALNAAFGPGTARLAKVKVQLTEDLGVLHVTFDVQDPATNLRLKATAQAPMTLNTRSISDQNPLPYRTFNGLQSNGTFRGSSQSDLLSMPVSTAFAGVTAPNNRMSFANGSVTILALGANVTFNRGLEFYIKFD